MSTPDIPFGALGDHQIDREAIAILCSLDGLAVSQALAVLDRARDLIFVTQRIGITPELISAAEAAGPRHASG